MKKKERGRPSEAKDKKTSSRSYEQLDPRSSQGNCAVMPYSAPIAPCFWPNSCYYAPLDYSRMHLQPYFIQYPHIYPNCGTSQRPIVASNNPVRKDFDCSKEGEKSMKQDSKYLQKRWCPSGLSHTQKRRLQRLRKKELMEQQVEVEPTKPTAMKKIWRPKQIVSSST